MELLLDEKNRKMFYDENVGEFYTMLDMGCYVDHRNRLWYEKESQVWRLMMVDEKPRNGHYKHIEALIDDMGNYSRIIVEVNNVKRIILLNNGRVFSDSIVSNFSFDGIKDNSYYVLNEDIYSDKLLSSEEYFNNTQNFYLNGRLFNGGAVNNQFVIDFFNKNNELLELISLDKKVR